MMPVPEGQKLFPHAVQTSDYHLNLRDRIKFGRLTFEGLPKGSSPENVVRCIKLLEHVSRCDLESGKCPEGEGCRRTRQVLAHHFACKIKKKVGKDECSICCQLLALCRNHSIQCQVSEENCAVPYCKNRKQQIPIAHKVQSNGQTEDQTREEFQYVIKKLSEALDLPTKQQKLSGVIHLLKTNRCTTVHVLSHMLDKKQKSQPVSLCNQMSNLTIKKEIKPMVEKCHQKVMSKTMLPSLTCMLKLTVLKQNLCPATRA